MIQLYYMPPYEMAAWASRLAPHFQTMADKSRGRMLSEDIYGMAGRGEIQVWIVLRDAEVTCCIITEVQNYPRLREMRLVALVGRSPKTWAHVLGYIENSAKVNFGCSRISGIHPKRFRSLLPGYEATHWLSEKAL